MSETTQQTSVDPTALAQTMARELAAKEEQRRIRHRRKLEQAAQAQRDETSGTVLLPDGRRVEPMACYMDVKSGDWTGDIPAHLIKPGWCVRWVRTVDNDGKPARYRVRMYQQYGYEEIINPDAKADDKDKTFHTDTLVAMQGPPEGLAAFMVHRAKPGTMNAKAALEQAYQVVDDVNSQAGREVVSVHVSPSHGFDGQ